MQRVSDFFRPRDLVSIQPLPTTGGTYPKADRGRVPETLVWDVSYKCNLKCTHCYNGEKYGYDGDNYGNGFNILDTEQSKQVVDLAKARGIVHIHMLGGEPFTRRDLPELIGYATEKGMAVTLTSNGTMITERLAEDVIEAGTEQISISLDGARPETNDAIRGAGTFKRILGGLRVLCSARRRVRPDFQVGLTFTLTSLSLDEMPDVVELARDNELDVVVLQDLFDLGLAVRRPDLFYSNQEKLAAFEKLAAHLMQKPILSDRPVVQVDTHYAVFRYLERKYRPGFVTPQRNPVCPAVTNQIYMDSSGYIHPCGISTNVDFLQSAATEGTYEPENVHVSSIRSLGEVTFPKFLDARDGLRRDEAPCPTCDYQSDCMPCHFLMYSEQPAEAFDICHCVFKREAEFEAPVINGTATLANPVLVKRGVDGSCLVEDERTGKQFHVRGSGMRILGLIPNAPRSVPVDSLVDALCEFYHPAKRRNVTRDVVDFIWSLKLLGVLEVSSNNWQNLEEVPSVSECHSDQLRGQVAYVLSS